ncbi:anti-sigma factor family protein [Pedococcus sp. NPDC057267]|uniref:anti-sigma factor family protein n=1 Tax=Pedococcus sp. NPDC057267 TaxID=3346077 RepID=UPI00363BD38F
MTRLGLVGGPAPRGGRCLGDRLTAYADRAMDAASLLHWDRHLVACTRCRALVEQERRVLDALRAPACSAVPGDLRSLLLAVAEQALGPESAAVIAPTASGRGASRAGSAGPHFLPPVPVAPVPVVDRSAPALHRSVRRATVFAGIAAGATAAAAWGLVVTGGSAAPSSPTTPASPAVQRTRSAQPGFATAAFTVRGLGSSAGTAASVRNVGPTVSGARQRSAESTP